MFYPHNDLQASHPPFWVFKLSMHWDLPA
jgi:hypothetical protein